MHIAPGTFALFALSGVCLGLRHGWKDGEHIWTYGENTQLETFEFVSHLKINQLMTVNLIIWIFTVIWSSEWWKYLVETPIEKYCPLVSNHVKTYQVFFLHLWTNSASLNAEVFLHARRPRKIRKKGGHKLCRSGMDKPEGDCQGSYNLEFRHVLRCHNEIGELLFSYHFPSPIWGNLVIFDFRKNDNKNDPRGSKFWPDQPGFAILLSSEV